MTRKKKKQAAGAQAIGLALRHHRSGNLQEADKIYRQVLKANPKHADANHFLGVIAYQSGKYERAVELIRRSIKTNPNNAAPYSNLGLVLQELGKYDEMVASYRKVIKLTPDNTAAHNNLGNALHELGRFDEAVTSYCEAIRLMPEYAEAYNNLGNALNALGRKDEAVNNYGKALTINPDYTNAYHNFSKTLANTRFNTRNISSIANLKDLLISCLRRNDIEHQDIFLASLSVLFDQDVFDEISGYLDAASDNEFEIDFLENITFSKLFQDELFLLLLKKTVIEDPLAERFVTRIRKNLLLAAASNSISDDQLGKMQSFILALACQCFWNEYVFFQTSEEQQVLGEMSAFAQDKYASDMRSFPVYTALLACYAPLNDYDFLNKPSIYESLTDISDLTDLVRMQIEAPLQEKKIASGIKTLSDIEDEVSIKVREQYEENPYPRWIGIYKATPQIFANTLRKGIYPNKLRN